MNLRRLLALAVGLALLLPAVAAAAPAPSQFAAPCAPGSACDPTCDADQDGDVDNVDNQLTAGRCGAGEPYADGPGWSLTGNAGTVPGTNFLGTTDNQALELRVNGNRGLLIQPGSNGRHNVIGGQLSNGASPGVYGATIGGGGEAALPNWVYDNFGTVGGGAKNQAGNNDGLPASAPEATVGGGFGNRAFGGSSTVAGGHNNMASGSFATVAGGVNNTASGNWATVAGGMGNTASGGWATVAGGRFNVADGSNSFAAGHRAKAKHTGAFVLADSSDFDVASTTANSLRARFTGGMRMIVGIDGSGNITVNCLLSQGTGSWSCSSLNAMENVQTADSRDILDRLSQVPVLTWQAGAEGVPHIGPAEEAFQAAFGLGQPGEGISTIDLDGVALASIQALYKLVQEKDAQIAALRQEKDVQIAALQQENADLQARLAAIEQALGIGQ